MKSLARGCLWWPRLDAAIVDRVQQCHVCVALGKFPSRTPLYPWKWPAKPWERIHIDFFEKGKLNFLIVVDAYSKWLEVTPMGSMSQFENHRGFALVVCTLRNTGRGGFGQRAAASIGRFLSILESSLPGFHRTILLLMELLNVL